MQKPRSVPKVYELHLLQPHHPDSPDHVCVTGDNNVEEGGRRRSLLQSSKLPTDRLLPALIMTAFAMCLCMHTS